MIFFSSVGTFGGGGLAPPPPNTKKLATLLGVYILGYPFPDRDRGVQVMGNEQVYTPWFYPMGAGEIATSKKKKKKKLGTRLQAGVLQGYCWADMEKTKISRQAKNKQEPRGLTAHLSLMNSHLTQVPMHALHVQQALGMSSIRKTVHEITLDLVNFCFLAFRNILEIYLFNLI